MKNTHITCRLIGRAALVGLLAIPAASAAAHAQYRVEERDDRRAVESPRARRDLERRLFTWRGFVDDDTRIYIRAGRVESQVTSGAAPRWRARVDRDRSLPRRDGTVRVEVLEGRGRVHVVQQPSARNDYTAIVRVKDGQRGAGVYRLATYFVPGDGWRGRGRNGDDDRDDDVRDAAALRSGDRVLRWSGQVDRELQITLRPDGLWHDVEHGERPRDVTTAGVRALPRRDGYLDVSLRRGRGLVYVVQQPSRVNGYTAILRIRDTQASFGWYDFDVIWR